MSKLYFKYGTMDAAKSAELIMVAHKYINQGKRVIAIKPSIDTRVLDKRLKNINCLIESRAIKDKLSALVVYDDKPLYNTLENIILNTGIKSNIFYDIQALNEYTKQNKKYSLLGKVVYDNNGKINTIHDSLESLTEKERLSKQTIILVDESQFLTKEQVVDLSKIVDNLNIPIICFGLKNTYIDGTLFEGSSALLYYADDCSEIKSVCQFCENKATMNLRVVNDTPFYTTEDNSGISIGDTNRTNNYYISTCREHYYRPPLKDGKVCI